VREDTGPPPRPEGPRPRPAALDEPPDDLDWRLVQAIVGQLNEPDMNETATPRSARGPSLPVGLDTGWTGRKMTLMSVNNEQGEGRDFRSRPRWSAGRTTDAVLRLLRGESLEELSRELRVPGARLDNRR
jgi:hypothetical protein